MGHIDLSKASTAYSIHSIVNYRLNLVNSNEVLLWFGIYL